MAEWNVNRFWDRTARMWVIHEQITDQVGPKQEFELLWKKMTEIHVLIESHL